MSSDTDFRGFLALHPQGVLASFPATDDALLIKDEAGGGPAAFDRTTIERLLRDAGDLVVSAPARTAVGEADRDIVRAGLLWARRHGGSADRILVVATISPDAWFKAWELRHDINA